MDDINFIRNLVDKLEGVMALEINPHSESGKATLNALSESELLLIVSPTSDIQLDKKEKSNCSYSSALKNTNSGTNKDDNYPQRNDPSKVDISDLTSREMQVLKLLTVGLSNKLIGRELNISYSTVKVHVKNILYKLKKHSRLEAAIWAVDNIKQDELNKDHDREENV